MNQHETPKPGRKEVLDQLERILLHPLFKGRDKISEILAILVDYALQGKSIDPEELRARVFRGPYVVKGPHLRSAIFTLRDLLPQFYEAEGKLDPLIIELPKPPSRKTGRPGNQENPYPVEIRYNTNRDDIVQLDFGLQLLQQLTPNALCQARAKFTGVISALPHNVEAHFRLVECLCILAIFVPCDDSKLTLLSEANVRAQALVQEHPEDCRSHVALGAALLCARKLKAAKAALEDARRLSPDDNSLYAFWLACAELLSGDRVSPPVTAFVSWKPTGDPDRIAPISNPRRLTAYGLFSYLTRNFDQAATILNTSLLFDQTFWITHLGLTLVCLATDNALDALKHYERMAAILGDSRSIMAGIGFLTAFEARKRGVPISPQIREDAEQLAAAPEERKDVCQLAFAALNIDDPKPKLAFRLMNNAIERVEPLAMLLPYFPIFDRWRDDSGFQALSALIEDILSAQ